MSELAVGSQFSGYAIEEVAGRGGMGVVYRATHLRLGRVVALKVLAAECAGDATFRARFKHESRIAAQIEHPHIVPVYDIVEEGDVLAIAMRYVDGDDLRSLLRREGALDLRRAATIVDQVAGALDAAHARGLVHRDVKPANVLLVGEPGHEDAYLTDFGIAKPPSSDRGLTETGNFVGTVDYIAPEQVMGSAVDARADVYALGCVLYQCLTGEVPFPRANATATILAHVNDAPPDLTAEAPGVPGSLAAILRRAMAKNPDERYLSAGDLGRAAIAAVEGRPVLLPERSIASGVARRVDQPTRAAHSAPRPGKVRRSPVPWPERSVPVAAGPGVLSTRTRTVLVTDVVGSTQLVARLGDRESERVFLSHFEDLQREVQRARGIVVKTLGDGMIALFETAADAMGCAVAMQQAVTGKPVVHGRRMEIRIGVSSGDVRLQQSDCHGVAVVEACRLCEAAAASQILVSESSRLLVRGTATACRQPGELFLKGVPEPVLTWDLHWAPEREAKLRVVIADDAVLLRQGVARVLEERGFDVVAEAGDGEEVVRLALELRPDVAVVDVRMPPTYTTEGLTAAERIRAEQPNIGLLILSQDVDEHSARRLLAIGRAGLGYVLKERVTHVGEFVDAVRTVAAGGTAFEAAVLAWLVGGDAQASGIRELSEADLDALRSARGAVAPGA